MTAPIPVFDGHNDTLLRLIADNKEGDNFFESPHGHGVEAWLVDSLLFTSLQTLPQQW